MNSWPEASLPTAPAKVTSAPSLAAATAWFQPLPPRKVSLLLAMTLSPGLGNSSTRTTLSSTLLPTTSMRFGENSVGEGLVVAVVMS